jgi:hypothetical protein
MLLMLEQLELKLLVILQEVFAFDLGSIDVVAIFILGGALKNLTL